MAGVASGLEIGSVFRGYRIDSVLGHGGMGAVYLATHLRLERRVAIKVLLPELAADESFRERFIRESQLAASLEHPNIVPVYDSDEEDGVLYIAMRFIEGEDLGSMLRRDGALDPAAGRLRDRPGRLGARRRTRVWPRPPRRQAREHPASRVAGTTCT